MTREIRDIFAECIRLERLGIIHPLWSDWFEDAREPVRMRADHIIRLLADRGVELVQTGEVRPISRPDRPVFWRWKIVDRNAERLVRIGQAGIEIVKLENGQEALQIAFPMAEAHDLAGRGLAGDRELTKEPGVITKLSAAVEAYRVNAVGTDFGGAA